MTRIRIKASKTKRSRDENFLKSFQLEWTQYVRLVPLKEIKVNTFGF